MEQQSPRPSHRDNRTPAGTPSRNNPVYSSRVDQSPARKKKKKGELESPINPRGKIPYYFSPKNSPSDLNKQTSTSTISSPNTPSSSSSVGPRDIRERGSQVKDLLCRNSEEIACKPQSSQNNEQKSRDTQNINQGRNYNDQGLQINGQQSEDPSCMNVDVPENPNLNGSNEADFVVPNPRRRKVVDTTESETRGCQGKIQKMTSSHSLQCDGIHASMSNDQQSNMRRSAELSPANASQSMETMPMDQTLNNVVLTRESTPIDQSSNIRHTVESTSMDQPSSSAQLEESMDETLNVSQPALHDTSSHKQQQVKRKTAKKPRSTSSVETPTDSPAATQPVQKHAIRRTKQGNASVLLRGLDYQLEVLQNLVHKLRNGYGDDYTVGIERDAAGKFDDVYASYKKHGEIHDTQLFIQVKLNSSIINKDITIKSLFDPTDKKTKSNLDQTLYFESFIKDISDPFHKDKKHIIFTNRKFDSEVEQLVYRCDDVLDELNYTAYKLRDNFEGIDSVISTLTRGNQSNNEKALEYLKRLIFVVDQPNLEEMKENNSQILKQKFSDSANLLGFSASFSNFFRNWLNSLQIKQEQAQRVKTGKDINAILTKLNENSKLHFQFTDPVKNFVGRTKELKQLKMLIVKKYNPPFVVVTGCAGIGKSNLVKKFIVDNKDVFEVVISINAESRETLTQNLKEACLRYRIDIKSASEHSDTPAQQYYQYLMDYWRARSCIVIFDNVDDRECRTLLERIIPTYSWTDDKNTVPRVIITSQVSSWDRTSNNKSKTIGIVNLKSFDTNEAISLLEDCLCINPKPKKCDLEKLVKKTSGCPLALQIVVATLNNIYNLNNSEDISIVENYTKNFDSITSTEPLDGYTKPLSIIYNGAKTQIQSFANGELALQLFNMLLFLDREGTHSEIFQLRFNDPSLSELENKGKIQKALKTLEEYNLISLTKKTGVTIHKLTQEIERKKLQIDKCLLGNVFRDLFIMVSNDMQNHESSDTFFTPAYLHYWLAVWKHAVAFDEIILEFSHLFSKLANDSGYLETVLPVLRKTIAALENSEKTVDVMECKLELAKFLWDKFDLGKNKKRNFKRKENDWKEGYNICSEIQNKIQLLDSMETELKTIKLLPVTLLMKQAEIHFKKSKKEREAVIAELVDSCIIENYLTQFPQITCYNQCVSLASHILREFPSVSLDLLILILKTRFNSLPENAACLNNSLLSKIPDCTWERLPEEKIRYNFDVICKYINSCNVCNIEDVCHAIKISQSRSQLVESCKDVLENILDSLSCRAESKNIYLNLIMNMILNKKYNFATQLILRFKQQQTQSKCTDFLYLFVSNIETPSLENNNLESELIHQFQNFKIDAVDLEMYNSFLDYIYNQIKSSIVVLQFTKIVLLEIYRCINLSENISDEKYKDFLSKSRDTSEKMIENSTFDDAIIILDNASQLLVKWKPRQKNKIASTNKMSQGVESETKAKNLLELIKSQLNVTSKKDDIKCKIEDWKQSALEQHQNNNYEAEIEIYSLILLELNEYWKNKSKTNDISLDPIPDVFVDKGVALNVRKLIYSEIDLFLYTISFNEYKTFKLKIQGDQYLAVSNVSDAIKSYREAISYANKWTTFSPPLCEKIRMSENDSELVQNLKLLIESKVGEKLQGKSDRLKECRRLFANIE